METVHEDRYVVFLLKERFPPEMPARAEQPVASCNSYAEARQVCQSYRASARDCVIRFVGPAGGGD